jgi:ribosomal protein L28
MSVNDIQEILPIPEEDTTIRVSKKTLRRLERLGKYKDSHETILLRLLDERDGIETSEDNRSW